MSSQDQNTKDQTTVVDQHIATHDLFDTANSDGQFTTLTAGLRAAGLAGALQGPGLFTMFAPTDEAFARLPKERIDALMQPENRDQLTQLLQHHVVKGAMKTVDLKTVSSVKPLQGPPLSVKLQGPKLEIGGANVVRRDRSCTNGVLHVIDTVLLPE